MNITDPLPPGKIAAVDFGTVRLGVAITDFDRKMAFPYENLTRRTQRLDGQWFTEFVKEERVVCFVVGLPLYPSGDESPKSVQAREFGAWLEALTNVPVVFYDERYSSKFADELMRDADFSSKKKKANRDKLAAYVLLASYLEALNKSTGDVYLANRNLE
ncbi:MAG: Holliday junction resolvase RuvX [Thermoguttaceae bacterium]|nr:Holliday junction resolvase RuvX [Thermoguttaceae bacterium]